MITGKRPVERAPRFTHHEYGLVADYGEHGLGCDDCGFDAHPGACNTYTCTTCGVDCCESGCSQHRGTPHRRTTERTSNPSNPTEAP